MMQRLSPPRAPELLRRVAPALGRPLALGAIGLGVGAAAFYGAVGGGRVDATPTPRPTVQVAASRPAAAPAAIERPATPTAPTPTAPAPTPTEAAVPTLAALAIQPSESPTPTAEPAAESAAPSPTSVDKPTAAPVPTRRPTTAPTATSPKATAAAAARPKATATARPRASAAAPARTPTAAPVGIAGREAKILPTLDGLPARLRSEPSATSPVIGQVPTGTTIRLVGGSGSAAPGEAGWIHVTWRGLTGYLPAPLVK